MSTVKMFRFALNRRSRTLHHYPAQERCHFDDRAKQSGRWTLVIRKNERTAKGARLCAYCFK